MQVILTNVSADAEKSLALRAIEADEGEYQRACALFGELEPLVKAGVTLRAVYELIKADGYFGPYAPGCPYLFLCMITAGPCPFLDSLFASGDLLAARLADAIADQMLYSYADQIHKMLQQDAAKLGSNLTRRISPGSILLPFDAQREIFSRLDGEAIGVGLMDNGLLSPMKSMTYFYGAGPGVPADQPDHDCALCGNLACNMRVK